MKDQNKCIQSNNKHLDTRKTFCNTIGNGKIKYPYSSQHSARCFDCPLTQSDNGLYLLNGSKTNECGKSLLHNSCEY